MYIDLTLIALLSVNHLYCQFNSLFEKKKKIKWVNLLLTPNFIVITSLIVAYLLDKLIQVTVH